jgi:tetratricopeptide (TPR) repeat protein
MTAHTYFERLRDEIAEGHALAIIGAGISIGATGNARAASWTGLLEDGVDRCQLLDQPAEWADRVRAEIRSGDMDDLLSAAEKVSRKLGAPKKGEFHRWLREAVGALEAKDRAVLDALRDLGIPLATTNYDDLLEDVTGLPPVTWRDGSRVERLLRGDEKGILHLHGHWDDPDSVVLGIRTYEEVRGDPHTQAVLRALRTLRTLIFIGCGDGLSDPNFGAFLTWTREVLPGTEYPHYRLCRDGEVVPLRSQHPDSEPIVLLPYGPNHSDLVPFLRALGTARPRSAPAPDSPRSAPRLPPLPRCFGRDDEVETLVAALCADPTRPIPILGPGGVGKTTVTLAAFHDRRVADRFGSRRWFIRCESATSRDALIGEIAIGIGIEPGGQLAERIFRELERERAALVLDNAETPWEGDQERTEELFAQLAGLPGLALAASIRGAERPQGPDWREAIWIGPLSLPAAQDAFLAVAGRRFKDDPDLDRLLEAVDRLPLAVTLLACQAEADPDLAGLWSRWQKERTELLRRGDGTGRLTSLEVSLETSIKSPRMTETARGLLSLLGILPDGIAHEDLPALIPDGVEVAANALRRVGLAFSQSSRLRMLAPVREHIGLKHPPSEEHLDQARLHYLKLAKLGKQVGTEGGAEAVQRLSPETGNLEAMIFGILAGGSPAAAMDAVWGIGELFRFSGIGTASLVDKAREVASAIGNHQWEVECIQRLGSIALARSNHAAARARYQEALPLFRHTENIVGEANCIACLGDIARERSDYDAARARYEEALPLYRRGGNFLGEANCITGLANIARGASDHDAARIRYEEALLLYRGIGDTLGEANCIQGLGDSALQRSDHDDAQARYKEALSLYRRVGSILGEANCLQGLGDSAINRSEKDSAKSYFDESLTLYSQVQELYSMGWAHVRLARIAKPSDDRQHHIKAARKAWTCIKRLDLVEGLDQEFGSVSPQPDPAS